MNDIIQTLSFRFQHKDFPSATITVPIVWDEYTTLVNCRHQSREVLMKLVRELNDWKEI